MTQLVFICFWLFPAIAFSSLGKDNNFENNLREACYGQIILSAKNSMKLFDKVKLAQESYRNTEFARLGIKPLAKIIPGKLYSEKFNQIWFEMLDDVNIAQGQLAPEKTKEYTLKLGSEFEKKHKNFLKDCSAIYTNIFTICAAQMGAPLTETQKDCVQGEVPKLKKLLDPLVTSLLDQDQNFDKLDKDLEATVKKSKDIKKAQKLLTQLAENGCHPDVIQTKFLYYIIKYHNHAYLKFFTGIIKDDESRERIINSLQDKLFLIREAGRKFDLTYFKEMLRLKFPKLNRADRKMLISQMKNGNAIKLIRPAQ